MLNYEYKKLFFTFIILSIFITAFSIRAFADTKYVSDRLIITMREGKGNEFKIIKTLKTGTPVEVLEEDDEQYMKVRIENGKEGWVLKRYITSETPKPVIIAGLQKTIKKLKGTIEKLDKERTSIRDDLKASKKDHFAKANELEKNLNDANSEIFRLTKEFEDMTKKYNTFVESSKDIVSVVSERDLLRKENNNVTEERDKLKKENEDLIERRMIYWFLAGAGVFFFGWISGKISRKKKRYY